MPKKIISGIVVSDKNAKTRVVEIRSKYRDPRYGKFVRHRTKCYVHDENNESALGDTVEIQESRPRSALKRWELLRVLEKSRAVDVAALKRGEISLEEAVAGAEVSGEASS
jgi:small subunit ribosomal protein S17